MKQYFSKLPQPVKDFLLRSSITYPLRWLYALALLPKTLRAVRSQASREEERVADLEAQSAIIDKQLLNQTLELERLKQEAERQKASLLEQEPLLSLLPKVPPFALNIKGFDWIGRASQRVGHPPNTLALEEKQKAFYSYYSEMGGDHSHILYRQYEAYLPLLPELSKTLEVLDIGCGAGEFLSFLSDRRIPAIGIDIDSNEVNRALAKGLQAFEADALEYLCSTTSAYRAITLFQVIEHMTPDSILAMLEACVSRLAPGGALFIETLNLRHPMALNGFYTDPTHTRPISDNYLSFLTQWVGLVNTRIVYTLPEVQPGMWENDPLRMYANYTVVGYKPI